MSIRQLSGQPIWRPDPARVAASQLTQFVRTPGLGAPATTNDRPFDYGAVWRWSVANPESFWREVSRFTGMLLEPGSAPVLRRGADMSHAAWCADWRLNFAENLLPRDDDGAAIIFRSERGERRELSWAALRAATGRVAQGLRAEGVAAGDRVAGLLPNCPEAVIAMLATASIGAIWSSCSPDFGARGVLDRFGQIRPKLLFVADGYTYAGKVHETLPAAALLAGTLRELRRIVVVPFLRADTSHHAVPLAVRWADFGSATPPTFPRLPFNTPLYILYSSGTTGAPKCIVHGAGGTLLQHRKEHALHVDLRSTDRLFYFTTCGWMMWNWLASALAQGTTIVLYDGSPLHPGPGTLWELAQREGVTVFGTSPRYLATLAAQGYAPRRQHDLHALRSILSTGAPLAPELYDYVYRDVAPQVQLASISGGTDIVSCFALGNPWQPVYRGELQGPGLGMDVAVYDDDGRPLQGAAGELVCRAPFPSQPLGFWNDPDGSRYRRAYFERFPGVWHHGDYAAFTEHGGLVISGRSDAVLNPGGVRIGTAEIYRQVEAVDGIAESLAVGQQWHDDIRVVLFVRLRDGVALTAELTQQIRAAIRDKASPRHVPAKIIAVPDLPRTLNGKLAELAVRDVIHGREVGNRDALANPQALVHFADLEELRH